VADLDGGWHGANVEFQRAGGYQPSQNPVPNANYDVSTDGQRFLMIKPGGEDQAATQINLVPNWFEELKRRAPAKPRCANGDERSLATNRAVLSL
jgi:hypothetical protein